MDDRIGKSQFLMNVKGCFAIERKKMIDSIEHGSAIKPIAFIENYLQCQCGIATFTTNLCESIAAEYPDTTCIALPVNDTKDGYAYPPRGRFDLIKKVIDSYRRAADFLNINRIDFVCLEHEDGTLAAGQRVELHPLRQLSDR